MKKRNPGEYVSVKVPRWVYENWRQAARQLTTYGLQNLPREVVDPESCPICKTPMRFFRIRYEYLTCPNGHYTQQRLSTSSNIFGGVIFGLGLGLLIHSLSSNKT